MPAKAPTKLVFDFFFVFIVYLAATVVLLQVKAKVLN